MPTWEEYWGKGGIKAQEEKTGINIFENQATPTYETPTGTTFQQGRVPSFSELIGGVPKPVGNVSGSQDLGKSYTDIFNSTRNAQNMFNQFGTVTMPNNNVYDTTQLTPQQIYAFSVSQGAGSHDALRSMGLDILGRPSSIQNTGYTGVPSPSGGPSAPSGGPSAPSGGPPASAGPFIPGQGGFGTPGMGGIPAPPKLPVPTAPPIPVRNRDEIAKYVDGQIAKKISDATLAKTQAERTAQEQAGQYKTTVNNQLQQAVNRLTTGATQAQQNVQTGFDRMKGQLRDDRVLEDVKVARQLDPFSGRSDYAQGMIARERGITDRQANEDYQSRVGNINQDLANTRGTAELDAQTRLSMIDQDLNATQQRLTENYAQLQSSTGTERERLLREIENDERQYALALRGEDRADILGNAQLAHQAFNESLATFQANRGVYESDRGYNFDVNKYNNEFDWRDKTYNLDRDDRLTDMYGETYGGYGSPSASGGGYSGTPSRSAGMQSMQSAGAAGGNPNVAGGGIPAPQKTLKARMHDDTMAHNDKILKMEEEKVEYQKTRDSILDKRYTEKFDEDVRQFGLTFAVDEAYKKGMLSNAQAQTELEREKLSKQGSGSGSSDALGWARLGRDLENDQYERDNPKPGASQYNNVFDNLAKQFVVENKISGAKTISDKDGLRRSIINMKLDPQDTKMLLSSFGLPLTDERFGNYVPDQYRVYSGGR